MEPEEPQPVLEVKEETVEKTKKPRAKKVKLAVEEQKPQVEAVEAATVVEELKEGEKKPKKSSAKKLKLKLEE